MQDIKQPKAGRKKPADKKTYKVASKPGVSGNDALNRARTEAAVNLDGWQRAQAELANYKKQTEARVSERAKFAERALILDLLPVLDNFEHAYAALSDQEAHSGVGQGFGFIKQQLEKVLTEYGVEAMQLVGKDFDPTLAEAVKDTRPEDERDDDGTVTKVIVPGYMMHGEVLRHAQVEIG